MPITKLLGGAEPTTDEFDERNVEQIGDNVYKFNLVLNNGETKIALKFSAIEELSIIDDLKLFYVYGKCSFKYNENILEAFDTASQAAGMNVGTSTKPYKFRGDGRDILEIDIMPQLEEQQCLEVFGNESEKEKYNIKHACSIYHYEDKTVGQGNKIRTLFFWDQDFQALNEVNLDYSSGEETKDTKSFLGGGESGVPVSQSNSDKSIFTGDIMEDLLEYGLVELADLDFKKGDWDTGTTKLNFHSTGMNKAVDDIDYVLTYHMSDESNYFLPAILKKQRYTEKYELKPLNKFYENTVGISLGGVLGGGGSDVLEDFLIGNISPDGGEGGNSDAGDIIATNYNTIEDYTFVRVDSKDLQSHMATHAVHGLDPRGFFKTNLKDNNFKSATSTYKDAFVQGNGADNLAKNNIRKTNKNQVHMFLPYELNDQQTRALGVNKAMKNMFYKNSSITFKVIGNTIRKTGKFFTINRKDSNITEDYDNSVLGKYMYTYVCHEFSNGSYFTTILGVKPFDTKDPGFTELN
jgi:hypothetical protein